MWGPAAGVFQRRRLSKKNLKPLGRRRRPPFSLSGEKELCFLGFLFFLCIFSCFKINPPCIKIAPPKNQFSMVFIGKLLLGFSTWSLNFLFFFVNFVFSYFFVFFENEQYQRRLKRRKINDFKNDAWKVERVWKSFEKLNSLNKN